MHLFNYAGSANGYKVELLLALLGKRYERTEVSIFAGTHRTPEHLQRSPGGGVPLLQCDDGSWLPESNAILVHVARGSAYWPTAPATQDRVLAWLMYEQSDVEPVIGSARFWKLTGRAAERADEFDRRMTWARTTLATLDRELANRPFLVGEQPTVADIAVYGYAHLAGDLELAFGANVERWCRRIEALPGYIAGPSPYDPLAMAG
jgi:glutathione S-transferase